MRIAVNGTGVAGPALAWWLKKYGYEPVLFERSPQLRSGGYIIDFWGIGYDIAERMGILGELQKKGYLIDTLQVVDGQGKTVAGMSTEQLRAMIGGRFLSIPRGELAATLYHACGKVESHFGTHIINVEQNTNEVRVELSDGSEEQFDLVIGADGLHSHIRTSAFGPDEQYEHGLGAYVAAFTLSGYQPRDELTYVTHPVPKKMVARASLRDDKTLFLFTFRSELVQENPETIEEVKTLLRSAFGDMQWEVPSILERLDEADDLYFDHVSQIRMDRWSEGRVALIGDAAACVSLLAGEGTGLAILEAYVLAGELYRSGGDYKEAFHNYEQRLKPFLNKKQKSALSMIAFFAPKNKFQVFLSRVFIKASSVPFLSRFLLGRTLRDDFDLPEYEASTGL